MPRFYLRYNPRVMKPSMLRTAAAALFVTAFLGSTPANAVRLDPEAGGQVLIYPYYTVRSYGTDPYNTYISIVNTSADAKALRVYFHEGKAGLVTLAFNLFLSPNDTWTGALVPSSDGGAQLITRDASCVSPAMPDIGNGVRGAPFRNFQFATDSLDRTREGYAEMIEMATLTGATAAAITQDASGIPHDCAAVQAANFIPPLGDQARPSGGLQGTLTLINVASGMDFTVNAEALADFSTISLYTAPATIFPDLSSAEPVSVVTTPTHVYRLDWARGIDAVSSVLMQWGLTNEYVLDTATASSSDWVLTFPTRSWMVTSNSAQPPFSGAYGASTCEYLALAYFNRESAGRPVQDCSSLCPPSGPAPTSCNATSVWSVTNSSGPPAHALFSSADGLTSSPAVLPSFQNGWAVMFFTGANATSAGLVSLQTSSRMDRRTGAITTGRVQLLGLPVVGFFARSFLNGLLSCSSGTCQGAYGSAFRHHARRLIRPSP